MKKLNLSSSVSHGLHGRLLRLLGKRLWWIRRRREALRSSVVVQQLHVMRRALLDWWTTFDINLLRCHFLATKIVINNHSLQV